MENDRGREKEEEMHRERTIVLFMWRNPGSFPPQSKVAAHTQSCTHRHTITHTGYTGDEIMMK